MLYLKQCSFIISCFWDLEKALFDSRLFDPTRGLLMQLPFYILASNANVFPPALHFITSQYNSSVKVLRKPLTDKIPFFVPAHQDEWSKLKQSALLSCFILNCFLPLFSSGFSSIENFPISVYTVSSFLWNMCCSRRLVSFVLSWVITFIQFFSIIRICRSRTVLIIGLNVLIRNTELLG